MQKKLSSQTYFLSILLVGIFSLSILLVIPGDAKNARLLGFSNMRLVMLGAMVFSVLIVAWLTFIAYRSPAWSENFLQRVSNFLEADAHITSILTVLLWGFFGGIYFLYLTFTTTDQFKLGYFYRLTPWFFWLASICGISLFFLIFRNIETSRGYFRKHGLALGILQVILFFGLITHSYLWHLEPSDWDVNKMFDAVNKFDLEEQDIFAVFNEGDRLQQGENPYEQILSPDVDMKWNQTIATYFPAFYYLSWFSQEIGLEDYVQWLGFWRVMFLAFNLGIAYILFYVPYHRFNSLTLAVFSALFWLFSRWTLHITMIYHIEFIAIFFLLLSLTLLPKNKKLSFFLFGMSLAVKQIAIFMIPLYLIWAWQLSNNKNRSLKQFSTLILLMASIPFLLSLPFLVWNLEGFVKSVLISATRVSESHFGVPSLDMLIGLSGIPAKLPMLGMMVIVFILAWKQKINYFVSALFIMIVFVDFNSVLFRQYMAWVVPLIPLAICQTIRILPNNRNSE